MRIGIAGLGMMGLTHLDVYRQRHDATVVALCDIDPDRLSGKVQAIGNIDGQAQRGVASLDVKRFHEVDQLIEDAQIDIVDICLPTDLHVKYGMRTLQAGKHLIVEKPLGRTSGEAQQLVDVAAASPGLAFVGHCMRFWPGWSWLKQAIDGGAYGHVLSATFRRVASYPDGTFYHDGKRAGGAALDLHIHDTDFIQFCFGVPISVTSFGFSSLTSEFDHIVTRYEFGHIPLVTAEGSWNMAQGFPFSMGFTVNFEHATAVWSAASETPLVVYGPNGQHEPIPLDPRMGYDLEIDYFLDCAKNGKPPTIVTLEDALVSLRIVEAEIASARGGGRTVRCSGGKKDSSRSL